MKDVLWAYTSKATSIASSLIIMPFALAFLSEAEFSIWMVFVVFFGMLTVIDFGFSVSISRQLNFILRGAKSIAKNGVLFESTESRKPDQKLLSTTINSSRVLFVALSILVTLSLFLLYPLYIEPVASSMHLDVFYEYLLYSASIILLVYCFYYNALFFGTFNVHSIYVVNIISNFSFFIVAVLLLNLGEGLLSIAIARAVGAFMYLFSSIYQAKKINFDIALRHFNIPEVLKNMRLILPNSFKLGIAVLGAFLASKSLILITTYYLPPSSAASFSFTHNILSTLVSLSLVFMTVNTPLLNSCVQERNFTLLLSKQKRIRYFCLLIFVVVFVLILFLGTFFLKLIESQTQLLNFYLLLALGCSFILELNRQLSTNFLMCFNEVEFHKSILVSGIFTVVLTYLCFEYFFKSLLVPIVIYLVVQLLYNFWYWTYKECKIVFKFKKDFNQC